MIKVPGHNIWFAPSAFHSMQIYPEHPVYVLTLNIGLREPLCFTYETLGAAEAVAQVLADALGPR